MKTYGKRSFYLRINDPVQEADCSQHHEIGPFILSLNEEEEYLVGQFLRSNKYKEKKDPCKEITYEVISKLPEALRWHFSLPANSFDEAKQESVIIPCSSMTHEVVRRPLDITRYGGPPIVSKSFESSATLKLSVYRSGDQVALTLPEFHIPFKEIKVR